MRLHGTRPQGPALTHTEVKGSLTAAPIFAVVEPCLRRTAPRRINFATALQTSSGRKVATRGLCRSLGGRRAQPPARAPLILRHRAARSLASLSGSGKFFHTFDVESDEPWMHPEEECRLRSREQWSQAQRCDQDTARHGDVRQRRYVSRLYLFDGCEGQKR